jgi:uncharacterized membrane protein
MTFTKKLLGALLCGTLSAAAHAAPPKFVRLHKEAMIPIDMDSAGDKVVGSAFFGQPIFVWSRGSGLQQLGGGCTAGQVSISGDGSTIVGCIVDEVTGVQEAALWLGGTDWKGLGSVDGAVPCGFDLSSSWNTDETGSTAVGLVWLADVCRAHAGAWDLVNGGPATDLGSLFDNSSSRANAISGSGNVIAGWQDDARGQRLGAKWGGPGERLITTGTGQHVGEVAELNFDGSAMTGQSYPYGSDDAWVWTKRGGFQVISTGTDFPIAIPTCMNESGSLVGGTAREFVTGAQRGWVFADGQLVWIDEYLASHGLADGWTIFSVTAMSNDGTTLAGFGLNPDLLLEGFVIEGFGTP